MFTIDQLKERTIPNSVGCWEWRLFRNKAGYGLTHRKNKKTVLAHRLAYEAANGPFDNRLCVLHKCDNPPCINPAHLKVGTQLDNLADMRTKKRGYSKLSAEQVREIRASLAAGVRPIDLSREYGVKPCQIGAIKFNRQWRNV